MDKTELRLDPLTRDWTIFNECRALPPTNGSVRDDALLESPFRAGLEHLAAHALHHSAGERGWQVRVVPNKFAALDSAGELTRTHHGLKRTIAGVGVHEVIIETPDHDRTLADLSVDELVAVFGAYRDRILDLKQDKRFKYILIFKNHGEAAGASLEHTHSQLIALPVVPKRVREELDGAKRYFDFKERVVSLTRFIQPTGNIDADFAKGQLSKLLTDHYMHPSGELPAYEWNFSDVNPPIHAWACWRVFQIERARTAWVCPPPGEHRRHAQRQRQLTAQRERAFKCARGSTDEAVERAEQGVVHDDSEPDAKRHVCGRAVEGGRHVLMVDLPGHRQARASKHPDADVRIR
mgnify:CR=1 FL=1